TRQHPRDPLPDTLTWETASVKRGNRAHWLVIDELAPARKDDAALDDPNLIDAVPKLRFGVMSAGNRIVRVMPGSNAERIGLRPGDALVRLNDESARVQTSIDDLFERIEPGAAITLLVARANAPLELSGVYRPQSIAEPPREMFDRGEPSGRVDLSRTG